MEYRQSIQNRNAASKSRTTQKAHTLDKAGLKLHPMQQLQRTLGNRAVQRLMENPKPAAPPESDGANFDEGLMAQPGEVESVVGAPAPLLGQVAGAPAVQRNWLGDLVDDAGSTIASGAESVWDAGSSAVETVGSGIASGAETVWDVGSEAASGIYEGMKENAGYVRKGVGYVDQGIDWLEDEAKGGTHWLAQQAEGIPVLEQLAGAGESVADTAIEVQGGILKGATDLVGSLAGIAANPVDTAIGLEGLAEHARIIPGMPNPLQIAHGLYNVVANDADLGSELNRTLNPAEIMKGDFNMMKGLATGIAKPYMEAYEQGKYGEMAGRGAFDIGMLLLGVGEAGAAAEGAEALGAAGEMGMATEGAEALGAAGELSAAAEGTEGLAAMGELGATAEGAEAAAAAAEGAEASALGGMDIETLGTPTGELAGLTEGEIDAFVGGLEGGGASSETFFEFPGQNVNTGGGLQEITTTINPNPNQISYSVNHYFSDIGSAQIADMAEVPMGAPRGIGGSMITEGAGTAAEATPQTFMSVAADDSPVLNAAGEGIGSSNVEARYHSANPRFPDQGPTVQINSPSDRFGWAGDRGIAVEGETARYLLPDGTYKTIAEMTPAERAVAHWPTGGH